MTLKSCVTAVLGLPTISGRRLVIPALTAIALCLGSGCVVAPHIDAGSPTTTAAPSAVATPTPNDAELIAKDCHTKVLPFLKSPGSATFDGVGETATEHFFPANGSEGREVDHHSVVTLGHVDSQNSFGGLLRTSFYCFTATEAGGSLVVGRPVVSQAGVGDDVSDMLTQLDQNKAHGGW